MVNCTGGLLRTNDRCLFIVIGPLPFAVGDHHHLLVIVKADSGNAMEVLEGADMLVARLPSCLVTASTLVAVAHIVVVAEVHGKSLWSAKATLAS